MYKCCFLIISLMLSILIGDVNNASLNKGDSGAFVPSQGLYDQKDQVYILTVQNFKVIYNSPQAWFVEFYNTWCGHCQRFAPIWKALSANLRTWQSLIKVAALDCANEDNSVICRDMEVMQYPSLRYFHENYQNGSQNIGQKVPQSHDVQSNKKTLVEVLIGEQQAGRGQIFPNLLPYGLSNTNGFFDGTNKQIKYLILILEDSNSLFGPELIMNLHSELSIALKYALYNNTQLRTSLDVTSYPAMILFSRRSNYSVIDGPFTSASDMQMRLREFLKLKNIDIPAPAELVVPDVPLLNITDQIILQQQRKIKERVLEMGDKVFLADLETAVRYSLKHEISRSKTIAGEKYNALLKYVRLLEKYFPFNSKGQRFISDLVRRIESSRQIDGKEVANAISGTENPDKEIWSFEPQWQGCISMQPGKRGYPCGLWKMFHYLTVNAAEVNSESNETPTEVLDGMLGYVKNFFGCSDCSQHFQQMVVEDGFQKVASYDEAVLWLWRAHNKVNKRLAQDETEDPEFPKIQFPSIEQCSGCKSTDGNWVDVEVLHYLHNMYNRLNIINLKAGGVIFKKEEPTMTNGSSGLFHKVDTSMCFAIYATSFVLVYVVIRIFLRRGYRKKMYAYDFLGKI